MAVQPRRDRTSEILQHYESQRARIGEPTDGVLAVEDIRRLEELIRETIMFLRENKAECVSGERRDAERIGGQRWAETTVVDLGYEQVKSEIDRAIKALQDEKAELRTAKALPPEIDLSSTAKSTQSDEQLIKLLDLHQMGVLTADEFAAAKQRLR